MSEELTDDYIRENWIGRNDVAKELGKSTASVTALDKKGKLRSRRINGILFYDPESVTEVKCDPEVMLGTNGETSELMAMARAVLELVKGPRKDIDELQFRMLACYCTENEKLRAENEKLRLEINQARDTNVERDMAVLMAKSDSEVKKIAGIRMVETISKLVTGIGKKNGVELTAEQLEALVVMSEDGEDPFLSPEQAAMARIIIKETNQKIASAKAATAQVAQQANGGAKS